MSSKCSVCSDPETSDNAVFYCLNCEVGVHKLCYGIDNDEAAMWLCSPCTSNGPSPICELCLTTEGAFKKTTSEGKWVHVICALFTEGVKFENKNLMEPVNISKIPEINRNQKCVFCKKTLGICCECTQPDCGFWLHITCAQKANCLLEVVGKNDKIQFQSFCKQHKPVDDSTASRRISSNFVREQVKEKSPIPLGVAYKLAFDVGFDSSGGSINDDSKSPDPHHVIGVSDITQEDAPNDHCNTISNHSVSKDENVSEVQSSTQG